MESGMTEKKHKPDTAENAPPTEAQASAVEAETAPAGENGGQPADVFPEIEALQQELLAAQLKANEHLDGWLRSQAEFSNYKKRVERDRDQARQNVISSVVKRYLEIGDDLERALKKRPTEGEGASWAEGIELVYRKLQSALEAEGVKVLDTQGQLFDPNCHEAISHEDSSDHQSGQIIEVVQPGYTIGERVIRPALVRVAR
jgi:molecular chaperone GrpE